MKFIYVLEGEYRAQNVLFETLKTIDPELHVGFFPNLDLFHTFLKQATTDGAEALARSGLKLRSDKSETLSAGAGNELALIIAKHQFLGIGNSGLLKQARVG